MQKVGEIEDAEIAKHIMDALFFKLQHEPTCEPPSLDRKLKKNLTKNIKIAPKIVF